MVDRASFCLPRAWHAPCTMTSMSTFQPTTESTASAPELLKKAMHDALELGRAELALAKREAVEQARSFATSAVFMVAALIMLQAAITTLGVLLLMLLPERALGFIVVAAFLAIAVGLGLLGLHRLQQNKVEVGQRAKRDAREIAEAVK